MNKVIITGRIANDLEIRKTPNNKSVLDLRIAVSRDYKDAEGNYPADFIKAVCWEQKADFISKYAQKGTMIGVSGRIQVNVYDDKNGQRVYDTYIQAEQVEILSQPREKEQPKEIVQEPVRQEPIRLGTETIVIDQDELPFY